MATALISPDTTFEACVRAVADAVERRWHDAHLRADPVDVAAAAAHGGVGTVVLGPGLPVDLVLAVARALDLGHPDVAVVVVAEPTPDVLREALRVGVRDVVPPDADAATLGRSRGRAAEASQRLRALAAGEAPAPPASRVLSVLSPKGGSGKTTVASNLALGLSAANAGKVALVDVDLQFGDVSTAMRLMPEHSIADAARLGNGLDSMALKLLLTPHASGVYALCGPENPADGEEVHAATVTRSIELLAEEFPFVVVDTAAGITEGTLAAAEISTDLVLVCTFDVPSVRSLRKVVQALDALGMVSQRRHFVLNRADSRVGLATEDVESTVGMTVDIAVPSSRAVPLSMNQGSPLVESDPRSPAARQLMELTKRFLDQPAAQQSASGGSRLFKRSAR